jgi:gluconolactonase
LGNYEGNMAQSEVQIAVYRVDGETLNATMVADDVLGPNGLAF